MPRKLTDGEVRMLKHARDEADTIVLGDNRRRAAEQLEFMGYVSSKGGQVIRDPNVTIALTDAGTKLLSELEAGTSNRAPLRPRP
jgi:hypothetical protein